MTLATESGETSNNILTIYPIQSVHCVKGLYDEYMVASQQDTGFFIFSPNKTGLKIKFIIFSPPPPPPKKNGVYKVRAKNTRGGGGGGGGWNAHNFRHPPPPPPNDFFFM